MSKNIIIITSIQDIDNYLKTQHTEDCNIVNYIWTEYGFYPIYFNELYHEFFNTCSGKFIGLCFEGQEILYEDKVDDLLILKNFIDTSKAYKNNIETELLINNFKSIPDKGIAFWYTVRNFDEDKYQEIISKYRFKNFLFPIGKDLPWKLNLFSCQNYNYAIGEKIFITPDTSWKLTNSLGWNLKLWKNYEFPNISNFQTKEYYCIFIKNTWKTRNYSSKNINDFLVGNTGIEGTKGYGFVDLLFYQNLINYFLNTNKKLIIINDLVKYPIPKHDNIIEFNMERFFNIKSFCSIVHNSKIFLTPSTSPLDLATYYCNTHIVCLDDKQNKCDFVNKVLNTKNKTAISYNMISGDFDKLERFIAEH